MKKKKVMIICGAILLAIIAVGVCYNMIYKNNLEKKIISVIEKNKEYKNYDYQFIPNEEAMNNNYSATVHLMRKDNYVVSLSEKVNIWGDDETGEVIATLNKRKQAIIGDKETIVGLNNDLITPFHYFYDEQYKIKTVQEEKYDNKSCYKVQLENKENSSIIIEYWIERESGILLKINCTDNNTIIHEAGEYQISLNTVKAEDVEKPNIAEYEVVQNIEE